MEPYTQKVMELFRNPKNCREIRNPSAIGKVGNPVCGDMLWIYILVEKKKGKHILKDVSFKSFGCVANITTSSVLTEMAKGKTIEDALKISKDDIIKTLGGLPKIKYHCSLLAIEGLREALYNYMKKENMPIPELLKKNHETVQKELKCIVAKTS